MPERRIAVVGAGMAGVACAAALRQAGIHVDVFEKSRGLGGRIATRRRDSGSFDHGAQYVTARGTRFETLLRRLGEAGAVTEWQPQGQNDPEAPPAALDQPWFIGTPGMSAMVKPLAEGLPIHRGTRIAALERPNGHWHLTTTTGEKLEAFDAVAVTVPAPQASTLLAAHGGAFARIERAIMAPCWAAMMSFEKPIAGADDVLRPTSGPVAWAARNSAKPGRNGGAAEAWVIHAGPAWSREHLENEPASVAQALLRAFGDVLGQSFPQPGHLSAHRWRYALCETPLQTPCLMGDDGTLGAAGDWCLGARVEAAYDSGWALGTRLAARFGGG